MTSEELFNEANIFWNDAYKAASQGWDIGYASKPLSDYIDQIENKDLKILIPGAGNAYEAEYLWHKGFKNLFVCDIAKIPLENLQKRIPDFPENQLLHCNFFEMHGQYDLILEQTFFCAIEPGLRNLYVNKIAELLKPNGKLVGVLFDDENLFDQHPPYKGTKEEYRKYFEPLFDLNTFTSCYNSIKPRAGREIFINLQLKNT
jgi:methyl halide transferase